MFLPNLRTEARTIVAGPTSARYESLQSLKIRLRHGYVGEFVFVPWEAVLVPSDAAAQAPADPGYPRDYPKGGI